MSRRKTRKQRKSAAERQAEGGRATNGAAATEDGRARNRATGDRGATGESRAADAITIAWMLTALATLAAQCGAWIGQAIVAWADAARDWPPQFLMLPGLMQFSALVTGVICLALTVAVHRVRATPPPQAIVRFAVAVGLLPLVAAVVRAFAPTP